MTIVAIYSIRMDEVYYTDDMESAFDFINDRARNPKDFKLLQLSEKKSARLMGCDLERKYLVQPYEMDRLLIPDEYDVFETFETSNLDFVRNIDLLVKSVSKLRFMDEDEFYDCIHGVHLYHMHLKKVMDYDLYCEETEDDCFGWMQKHYNLDVICDRIISDWTGKMTKEQREVKILENKD